MTLRILALLLASTSLAYADDLPALFNVTGVASDDVLNVRTRPISEANIVGALTFNSEKVEVVEQHENWGRVNAAEGTGWVSMDYMVRQPDSALPEAEAMRCFGTEPFWSLEIAPEGEAVLSTPEGHDRGFQMGSLTVAASRPSPFAVSGTAPGENITVVISKQICSDGMSDRLFGLEGTVVIGGYRTEVLSGCCSVQMN